MAEDKIDSLFDRAAIIKEFNGIVDETIGRIKNYPKIKADVEGAKSVKEFTLASAKMQQELKAVESLAKQRFATDAKIITLQTDYARATALNRNELQKQNAELKAQAALQQANTGSIERAMAAVKVLTLEQIKLNQNTAEGQKRSAELISQIDKYNAFIKKNSDALAQQKINVGNYSGAVNVLKQSLQEVAAKIDQNTKAGKGNSDVVAALRKEYSILDQLVNSQAAGFAKASLEIRANEKALLDLQKAGLQSTAAFKEISLATGKLKDDLADVRARTKALGSDTFVFDGLIQGAQGLAGAYGVAQGAASLFGKDNEDLQKTLVKLAAIMTVIQGLQQIQNVLQKESSFMLLLSGARTKALAIAQGLYAAATTAATTATRALSFALKASGIGLILTLLTTAAYAMSQFAKSSKDAEESIDDLTAALDKQNAALDKTISGIDRANEKQKLLNGSRLTGKNLDNADAEADINAELSKRDAILKDLDKGESRLNVLVKERQKIQKSGNLEKDKGFDFNFTDGDAKLKKVEEKITEVQKTQSEKRTKLIESNNRFSNLRLEQSKKTFQENEAAKTKAAEEAEAKRKSAAEKASAEFLRISEAERKAIFQVYLDGAEERARLALRDSENEDLPLQQRLQRLKDYSIERSSIIEAQRKFDLANTKLTETERLAINQRAGIAQVQVREGIEARKLAATKASHAKELAEEERHQLAIKDMESQNISNFFANEQVKLDKQFADKLISEEKYNEKKLQLQQDLQVALLKSEIQFTKELIKIEEAKALASGNQEDIDRVASAKLKLAGLEISLQSLITSFRIESNKEADASDEEAFNKKVARLEQIKDIALKVFGVISSIALLGNEKEMQALDERKRLLDLETERRINQINLLGLTEAERVRQTAIVQKDAAYQNEQIENRKRKLATERARFEKAASIANIIAETALAVVRALGSRPFTPANIALAAITGAIGAAQLAKAISTPIPKYKMGRGQGKDEIAIVGDGGVHEYIDRGTHIEKTPNVPTLTYLMGKDRVFKDENALVNAMLSASNPRTQITNIKSVTGGGLNDTLLKSLDSKMGELVKKSRIVINNQRDITSTAFYQFIKN